MDRIEKVRESVDAILLDIADSETKRCAYLHLYGVSQACALIAQKRRENTELAIVAGMLRDIYSYSAMDPIDHAHKGAKMAHALLTPLRLFTDQEITLICTAIYHHSDKSAVHGPLDEILKDADVMQHVLYNPLLGISPHEQQRYRHLVGEFGLIAARNANP